MNGFSEGASRRVCSDAYLEQVVDSLSRFHRFNSLQRLHPNAREMETSEREGGGNAWRPHSSTVKSRSPFPHSYWVFGVYEGLLCLGPGCRSSLMAFPITVTQNVAFMIVGAYAAPVVTPAASVVVVKGLDCIQSCEHLIRELVLPIQCRL